jgi:hypothetical protein
LIAIAGLFILAKQKEGKSVVYTSREFITDVGKSLIDLHPRHLHNSIQIKYLLSINTAKVSENKCRARAERRLFSPGDGGILTSLEPFINQPSTGNG